MATEKTVITRMDLSAEYRVDGTAIAYFSATFTGNPGSYTVTKQIYDRVLYDSHKATVDAAFTEFETEAITQSKLFEE